MKPINQVLTALEFDAQNVEIAVAIFKARNDIKRLTNYTEDPSVLRNILSRDLTKKENISWEIVSIVTTDVIKVILERRNAFGDQLTYSYISFHLEGTDPKYIHHGPIVTFEHPMGNMIESAKSLRVGLVDVIMALYEASLRLSSD